MSRNRVNSLKCLAVNIFAAYTCLTADPENASSIPARSNTFVDIEHEIISTVMLLLSADSRKIVDSYMRKYVHEVLVNRLVKLAKELWLGELTTPT